MHTVVRMFVVPPPSLFFLFFVRRFLFSAACSLLPAVFIILHCRVYIIKYISVCSMWINVCNVFSGVFFTVCLLYLLTVYLLEHFLRFFLLLFHGGEKPKGRSRVSSCIFLLVGTPPPPPNFFHFVFLCEVRTYVTYVCNSLQLLIIITVSVHHCYNILYVNTQSVRRI